MLDRFWYKHMAFAWEQEFRLAVSVRMAEEFGVQVPEADATAIRVAAKAQGLEDRIRITSMLGTPKYI